MGQHPLEKLPSFAETHFGVGYGHIHVFLPVRSRPAQPEVVTRPRASGWLGAKPLSRVIGSDERAVQ